MTLPPLAVLAATAVEKTCQAGPAHRLDFDDILHGLPESRLVLGRYDIFKIDQGDIDLTLNP